MPEPLTPETGLVVLHLFCVTTPETDRGAVEEAVDAVVSDGGQVVPVAILGHKADVAFMALSEDMWALKRLQTALTRAGLLIADSYLSITELSEYAQGLPEKMAQARLYPQLPPEGRTAWCFYPMSKRREPEQNWYTLPYEEREALMHEHGATGRKFAGRILQLITGSTGVDDFEWGVTLFAQKPEDLKDVVYTMRYDRASAIYAEFGQFFTGVVAPLGDVLDSVGVD